VVPTGKKTPVYLNWNQTINHKFLPFTFAAGNLLASMKQYVFNDDRQRPRRGYSAFRFVHMSTDAPALDIRFEGQTKPIFTNIGFGQATNYQELPHGHQNVQFLQAGTPNVVFEHKVKFIGDTPTSVFAEGTVAGKTLMAVVTRDL